MLGTNLGLLLYGEVSVMADYRVMKAVLDFGLENFDHVFLTQFLNHHAEYRETNKLIVNFNPDIQDGTDIVEVAL